MDKDFDPSPAAGLLAAAWRAGDVMSALPPESRPQTMDEGYDVQDRLIALLDEPVAGWKLGVGSPVQKRRSGIGRAIAGRILHSRIHRAGDIIALPHAGPVTIEFEIAYVLGRDILPDEPACPVLEAVADIRVAFELVLARFVDRRAVGWPSFAADNAAFHALVLGDVLDPGDVADLAADLVVTLDGREAARALQGEERTDPAAALADLVAIARARRMVLPKGSIVSTGTVSAPFDIARSAARVSARFLGRELGFRTAAPPPGGLGERT